MFSPALKNNKGGGTSRISKKPVSSFDMHFSESSLLQYLSTKAGGVLAPSANLDAASSFSNPSRELFSS